MPLIRIYHNAASPLQRDNLPLHLHHTATGVDVVDLCLGVGMAFKPVAGREPYPAYGLECYAVGGVRQKGQQLFFYVVH